MNEVNSFKYDSVNNKVAEHFGFEFRGGVHSRECQKFLDALPPFEMFNRVSVYHLFEGVMSGTYQDTDFTVYNYGFIPAMRAGGINVFRDADDFFCVQVCLTYHHHIKPASVKSGIFTRISKLILPKESHDDRYKDCINRVDAKISIEAVGNNLLIYKREVLSFEQKIQFIKDCVRLRKLIDSVK